MRGILVKAPAVYIPYDGYIRPCLCKLLIPYAKGILRGKAGGNILDKGVSLGEDAVVLVKGIDKGGLQLRCTQINKGSSPVGRALCKAQILRGEYNTFQRTKQLRKQRHLHPVEVNVLVLDIPLLHCKGYALLPDSILKGKGYIRPLLFKADYVPVTGAPE